MDSILKAFDIIRQELPKFASEMNAPFSKEAPPRSIMQEPSQEETVRDNERLINETLLSLAPALLPILKALQLAPRTAGFVANAGIAAGTGDPTAMLNGPLALAMQSNEAQAALLPQLYYHGTTNAFDKLKDGLKFFTPSPSIAESYALGGGGNRGSKSVAGLYDLESSKAYELVGDSEDGNRLIRALGRKDSPILEYDPYKQHFRKKGVPAFEGDVTSSEYLKWLAKATPAYAEDMQPIAKGANIRRVALDVDKPLDATFKGYDRNGKSPPIPALSEIDPKGNIWAERVQAAAKEGFFDWSNTKYPEAQKAWETVIIPQLQAKGYDSIKYWDDMHETMAVFSNKSVKEVPIFKPSEKRKDEAMANVLKMLNKQ